MGEIDQTDDCRLACLRTCVDRYLSQGVATIRNGVVSCHGGCSNSPTYHIKTRHDDMGQQNLPCFVVKWVIRTSWPYHYLDIEFQVVSNTQESCPSILLCKDLQRNFAIQTKTIQTVGVQALSLPAGYKRWRSPPNLDSNCFTKSSEKKKNKRLVRPTIFRGMATKLGVDCWGCFGSFFGEISHNCTPHFCVADPFHEVMKYISVWSDPFQVHEMRVRCKLKSGRSPSPYPPWKKTALGSNPLKPWRIQKRRIRTFHLLSTDSYKTQSPVSFRWSSSPKNGGKFFVPIRIDFQQSDLVTNGVSMLLFGIWEHELLSDPPWCGASSSLVSPSDSPRRFGVNVGSHSWPADSLPELPIQRVFVVCDRSEINLGPSSARSPFAIERWQNAGVNMGS